EFVVSEQSGDIGRRLFVPGQSGEVLFPIHRPAARRAMATVHVDDAVLRQLPKPEMERHGGVLKIPVNSLGRFEHDVLNHVTGINSPSHCLVEPHLDHSPDGIAVTIHQPIHCRVVTIRHLTEQVQSLFGFRPHVRGTFAGGREDVMCPKMVDEWGKAAAGLANDIRRPHWREC
ncbi:MAG: hypothetical protein RL215_516, partial [Planctomycetota bacterium]